MMHERVIKLMIPDTHEYNLRLTHLNNAGGREANQAMQNVLGYLATYTAGSDRPYTVVQLTFDAKRMEWMAHYNTLDRYSDAGFTMCAHYHGPLQAIPERKWEERCGGDPTEWSTNS